MEFARTPASSGVSAFQPSPDVSLLREVNGWNHPAFRVGMQAADRTAYAGMFGSVPAWWVASALSENVDATDALHYSLAWAGTAGVVWGGQPGVLGAGGGGGGGGGGGPRPPPPPPPPTTVYRD
jgi:hypothetical protein